MFKTSIANQSSLKWINSNINICLSFNSRNQQILEVYITPLIEKRPTQNQMDFALPTLNFYILPVHLINTINLKLVVGDAIRCNCYYKFYSYKFSHLSESFSYK